MASDGLPQKPTDIQLDQALLKQSVVHENVAQEFIVTTGDKVRLCLRDHQDILRAQRDWLTPAGVFLALVTTLVAADFHSFLGLTPAVWTAVYVIGSLFSGYYLIRALITAFKLGGKGDIELVVGKLKQGSR